MRSIWTGTLSFGLVAVPVKLGSAVSSHKLGFRQIHTADHGRVRLQKVCALDEQVLTQAEIARAYATTDDTLVEISDGELKALPLPTAKTIEVSGFIEADKVDFLKLDTPYFVAPADATANKAYVLMREALQRSGKAAVGKLAMHNSEHLALVRAQDDVLILQTLRWPDEVKPTSEAAPSGKVKITDAELTLADTLINALGEADLDEYTDDYAEAVQALVSAKVEGVQAPSAPDGSGGGGKVVDLMAALEASVAQARSGGRPDNATHATVTPIKKQARTSAPEGDDSKAPTAGKKTAAAKKTATKTAAKSTAAKSTAAKKTTAKKTASGSGAGAAAKKTAKQPAKKTAAKKTVAKKTPAKKTPAKKTPAKKTVPKRTAVKSASGKRSRSA